MKKIYYTILCLALTSFFISCNDDSDNMNEKYPIEEKWRNINLSTHYQVPSFTERDETGSLRIRISQDDTLHYSFTINNLKNTDKIEAAYFHAGNIVENGPIILNLPVGSFESGEKRIALRKSLVDSLRNNKNEIYFSIYTREAPGGLLRGQLNKRISMSVDVDLTGKNEIPVVNTTATGKAIIRLTSDKELYYKLDVQNLEAGDALTEANIYLGNDTVSKGSILVSLCKTGSDFGKANKLLLEDGILNSLKNGSTYINAFSKKHAAGVVRGQISQSK